MPTTYDLIVVGAGIVGATAANLAIQANPSWSIALVDASGGTAGATRWSAGLSVPFGAGPEHRRLIRRSRQVYTGWRRWLPRGPIEDIGLLCVARTATLDRLRTCAPDAQLGPASDDDRAWLLRRYPDLTLAEDELLWRVGPAYRIDAMALSRALIARRPDVTVVRATVRQVRRRSDGWRVVTRDGGPLTARRVVLATGPWGVAAIGQPGAAAVTTKRVAALHAYNEPRADDRVVYFPDDDMFIMPLPARGYSVISFHRDRWQQHPAGCSGVADQDDLDAGRRLVHRRSAALVSTCRTGRAFSDAYAPGRLPRPQRLGQAGSLVLAGAGSGSGVRLAPAIASDALADLRQTDDVPRPQSATVE